MHVDKQIDISKISNELLKYSPLILSLLSIFSYLCSYSFELGCCTYLNIPFNLISINLSTILYFGGAIVIVVLAMLMITASGAALGLPWEKKHPTLSLFLALNLAFICFWVVPQILFSIDSFSLINQLIIGEMLFCFGWYSITKLNTIDKRNMVKLKNAQGLSNNKVVALKYLEKQILKKLFTPGFVIIFLFIMLQNANTLGYVFYASDTNYYLQEKSNFALVKKYDDNLIFVSFDTSKNEFKDTLKILKASESSPIKVYLWSRNKKGISLPEYLRSRHRWPW